MKKRLLLFAAVAAVSAGALAGEALKPKALVIMLDGMRADAVENAVAPNLQMLRDGTFRRVARRLQRHRR